MLLFSHHIRLPSQAVLNFIIEHLEKKGFYFQSINIFLKLELAESLKISNLILGSKIVEQNQNEIY